MLPVSERVDNSIFDDITAGFILGFIMGVSSTCLLLAIAVWVGVL
jgi:uncharacterized membrane protein (Fun14 family)